MQVAENQRLVAIAEGDRKIAEAKADSASAVIAAAGRAEAIKKEQLNLSPMYLDYIKIQKWSGQNSQVVTGSGSTMLNLDVK